MKELEELKRILEFESKTNGKIPKPNYLYIANYGRSAKEFEKQFKDFSGKDNCFLFKPRDVSDRDIEDLFDNEVARNKPLGKDYDGVIIIDLSMLEPGSLKMDKFVSYLRECYSNNYIVFEINDSYEAEEVRKVVSNHFFVRCIDAPAYSRDEMLATIKKVVTEYNASITAGALKQLVEWAINRDWDKGENVEAKLISVTKDLLYEIGISKSDTNITKDRVKEILEKESNKKSNKITIGFHLGG